MISCQLTIKMINEKVWFGMIVMLIYLILGALVFLNLLIAMMAVKYIYILFLFILRNIKYSSFICMQKTFDSVQEDTTSAIIFARFKLALDFDYTGSFMYVVCYILFYFVY